ncbi:prefoldin subunit [Mucilaginibacter sp. HC2]|uniref:prefoldin subunit n=1 Tax=Mucilaginibacter inviolabilis TaxID=2714892 RepID=UPI0014094653|nr:prefoldin subunit [Mucilaginibacter inviolabilis]NHA05363.1 prefoldin subunit [Mucilaginibacter inviolabilis]
MKKTIFSLLLTLGFSPLLHAQWTTNGGVTSTTNSIGIGTTSPVTALTLGSGQITVPAGNGTNPSYAFTGSTNSGLFMPDAATLGFSLQGNRILDFYNNTARLFGTVSLGSTGVMGFSSASPNLAGNDVGFSRLSPGTIAIGNGSAGGTTGTLILNSLGIGTTAPQANIEVNNNSYTNGNQLIVSGSEPTRYYGVIGTTIPSGHTVLSFGVKSNYTNYFQTLNLVDDNVGIGTTDPKGYKLAVNGSVIATSMTVKVYANWPDYVFKKDYQLPSLQSVKTYIDQNQHLPEVPSEQDIAKNGLNLGEMNKVLMKKVEELTLYLIEKDKKDTEQNTKISLQNKQATEQAKRIEELESQVKFLMKKLNN